MRHSRKPVATLLIVLACALALVYMSACSGSSKDTGANTNKVSSISIPSDDELFRVNEVKIAIYDKDGKVMGASLSSDANTITETIDPRPGEQLRVLVAYSSHRGFSQGVLEYFNCDPLPAGQTLQMEVHSENDRPVLTINGKKYRQPYLSHWFYKDKAGEDRDALFAQMESNPFAMSYVEVDSESSIAEGEFTISVRHPEGPEYYSVTHQPGDLLGIRTEGVLRLYFDTNIPTSAEGFRVRTATNHNNFHGDGWDVTGTTFTVESDEIGRLRLGGTPAMVTLTNDEVVCPVQEKEDRVFVFTDTRFTCKDADDLSSRYDLEPAEITFSYPNRVRPLEGGSITVKTEKGTVSKNFPNAIGGFGGSSPGDIMTTVESPGEMTNGYTITLWYPGGEGYEFASNRTSASAKRVEFQLTSQARGELQLPASKLKLIGKKLGRTP